MLSEKAPPSMNSHWVVDFLESSRFAQWASENASAETTRTELKRASMMAVLQRCAGNE